MAPSPPPLDPSETNWIIQINESLESETSDDQQRWNNRSIYRVQAYIAGLNPKAYQPQVVSFGPYHHDDEHLLPMEEHKRRALVRFLKRSGKPLKPFLESLRAVVRELEESYDELDPKWKAGGSEDRFLELMITDGCFMLEIMRMAVGEEENDYAANDPIFSKHGKCHVMVYIRRDMLMLENQLPMKVLERLVAVERDGKEGTQFINGLILKFFQSDAPIERIGDGLHVLDVYRKSLLLPQREPKDTSQPPKTRSVEIIGSATDLQHHRIRFGKNGSSCLDDISFESGVLKLPNIVVDGTTESVYLNLIAFEHFHVGAGNEVTSYVFLMKNIINSEQDVRLLLMKGIIHDAIGSHKAVAELFNSLCKDMTLENNSGLDTVRTEVSKYCKESRRAWIATLESVYFKSPWASISFTNAFLVLVLATIQTVFTIYK